VAEAFHQVQRMADGFSERLRRLAEDT